MNGGSTIVVRFQETTLKASSFPLDISIKQSPIYLQIELIELLKNPIPNRYLDMPLSDFYRKYFEFDKCLKLISFVQMKIFLYGST